MNDFQFFIIVVLAMILLTAIIFNVPEKISNVFNSKEHVAMITLQSEIIAWKARVAELERLLEEERRRYFLLEKQFAELRINIEKIELNVKSLEGSTLLTKQKATLLVMGDGSFGETDRNALRRAGVLFHRLTDGSFQGLKEELQRKRQEGRQYKVVHISSHAGKEGVQFSDGVISGTELSNVIDGVELLFLASCSNISISDDILGVVKNIVVVYENIENESMQNFVFNFYNNLKNDFDIVKSFNVAISLTPDVSEFVDLRSVIY
jgi:hypothetical protein